MRLCAFVIAVLAFFFPPVRAQVELAIFEREASPEVTSAIRALEKSREGLLQAREAVEAAIAEVDRALVALRSTVPPVEDPREEPKSVKSVTGVFPPHPQTWVPAPRGDDGVLPSHPRTRVPAPRGDDQRAWLESAILWTSHARAALSRGVESWAPTLAFFREASCKMQATFSAEDGFISPVGESKQRDPSLEIEAAPAAAFAREVELTESPVLPFPRVARPCATTPLSGEGVASVTPPLDSSPLEAPSHSALEAQNERYRAEPTTGSSLGERPGIPEPALTVGEDSPNRQQ